MKEDNVFPMIPAGAALRDSSSNAQEKMAKPKGALSSRPPPYIGPSRRCTDLDLVRNKPGVLVRVALVFARRGYKSSLVVAPTSPTASSRA